ncbi:HAMP domain-containing protein [Leptospira ilyithenensis]|uniref:HAMP domain-containing protein n=1 Tax=Leptospira ilyithenensis TaxID=2484901 RepID=A0A4R9LVB0_9LEPT|nr:adenylate/guanylate cyclase domain-containing protein [Leptospira ilyithenensis]TGN13363.1 HAMP domain-containing protein [Leptospira ilyithenensis]
MSENQFKPSAWTIRLKLISMISIIIIFGLSSMIFLASGFFKDDSERRIQENNLQLASIIGQKVENEFYSIAYKIHNMATILEQNLSKPQTGVFVDLFFKNNQDFIYMAVADIEGESLKIKTKIYNEKYLNENNISLETIEIVNSSFAKEFLRAGSGATVVQNVSSGFLSPILGISIPFQTNKGNSLVLVYVDAIEFMKAFQTAGITTTFLINEKGDLLAHPDREMVLASKNLIDSPIVKSLMGSKLDNGQNKYTDKDNISYLGSFKKMGLAGLGIISTAKESDAFEQVYIIQRRNIYILLIILNLSVIIVFFFSKTISSPIIRLVSATKQIESGNFHVEIKPATRDEVGILTSSFTGMAHGLEEREKVKSILGSMIDPTVVQEAMIDMAALKRGSEKNITAFFSDVAGFSTISEQLKSEDLAALLNEYLSAMTIILKENDGVLDKYIGDAIVGIWNAPVDVSNHSSKAAKASIEMVRKLADLRDYWTKNNLYTSEAREMDARIGLNTGPAKVGFMGTDALASYTMMGDTVNLAARLEAAGKDYGVNILISETTKTQIQDEFFTRELDLVRVKGKNEPVKLYELIAFQNDVKESIAESAKEYEAGFKLYLKKDFTKAITKLNKAIKTKGKKDKAALMLIERCEEYMANPPEKGWDGVFTRTHK